MVSLWHAFDSTGAAARIPQARAQTARALPAGIRTAWRGELLGIDEARAHAQAWRDLSERALEPNPFLDPDIAVAAAIHLAQGHNPRFLLVWDEETKPARLMAAAALVIPPFGLGAARLWCPSHTLPGAPLVDRERADDALDGLFAVLSGGRARAAGLILPHIDETGVFAGCLRRVAARHGFETVRLRQDRPFAPCLERVRRDGARLVARTPKRVRDAVEHFLAIEASGASGRDGTAMLASPAEAAFLRVATRTLAHKRRCRVALGLRDGKPVAADILIGPRGRETLWKSATIDDVATEPPRQPGPADWLVRPRRRSPADLASAMRERLARALTGLR